MTWIIRDPVKSVIRNLNIEKQFSIFADTKKQTLVHSKGQQSNVLLRTS